MKTPQQGKIIRLIVLDPIADARADAIHQGWQSRNDSLERKPVAVQNSFRWMRRDSGNQRVTLNPYHNISSEGYSPL
jgi:hypothetical protein